MRIVVRGRIIASRKTLATKRVKKDHLLPRAGQGHLVQPANRDGADAAERDGDFEADPGRALGRALRDEIFKRRLYHRLVQSIPQFRIA
jgi:hypothetical protein